MPITESDLSDVYDGDVLSTSGEKIGSVGQVYLDDQTGEPTFVTANTGLFGISQSFVPLRGARVENGNVIVDFDKTTVKDAPRIDDDGSLSPAEEDQLYAYYGMGTTNADTADYGTADQTPEPGYARADRDDAVPGDSRLGDRTDDLRADESPGGRDLRSDDWGDRPAGAEERTAAAGTLAGDDTAATSPSEKSAAPSRGGRLRKWVMSEYEPVKNEEVYVEGSGQPGERPTR